ncbi:MAG: hypothetical protein KAI26_05985 [Nanoarchaeota archaeon]|nr:hypothetical protein [Nanoarchaeota archaeon]
MADEISKNLLLTLIIIAVVISVLSITLSIVALNQAPEIGQGQQDIQQDFGGTTSVDVPVAPSEAGAITSVEVPTETT